MTPGRNLFKEFKGNHTTFIETGSYRGDGIQLALDAGFTNIISIDIDPENIDFCMSRFDLYRGIDSPKANILLVCGDSAEELGKVVARLQEPAMFWLDAHAQHFEGEVLGKNPFPLEKELRQIRQWGVQKNTILVDDMLHLTHPDITGISKMLIEHWVIEACNKPLGSGFVDIKYFANPVKNSILLAQCL